VTRRFLDKVRWSEIDQLQRESLSRGDRRALGFLERQVARHPEADIRGRRRLADGTIVDDQTIDGMVVSWRLLGRDVVEMDRVFADTS
jgi:hypothetical protein